MSTRPGLGFGMAHLKLIGAAIVCAPCLIGMALSKKFMKRHSYYIISFAVACMLATVFLELLPELMHEAPGKIGDIRVHWVDGQEYAQMSKGTATWICAILLFGLIFAGFMEAFLHMISPHAHGHSHAHGAHGHGQGGSCDHTVEMSRTKKDSHGCEHDHHKHEDADAGKAYGHDGFYVDENGVYTNVPRKDKKSKSRSSSKSKTKCGHDHKHGSSCKHDHKHDHKSCGHAHGKSSKAGCGHKGHEHGKCGDHAHGDKVRKSIDLAKLEEGLPQIQNKSTTFGLPTLVVLDLLARSIHHTIDGVVAGVQDANSRSFWGTIMGLACHEIGHSLGGIGLYMNLGVGKAKAVMLVTCTQVITTFLGVFLGMLLTEWQTDVMLDIYMQPVAIGLMMYIALVDLLPELGHIAATNKQKMINVIVVIVAIFSVAGVGMLMPHSHGAGVGPDNYYQVQLAKSSHGHSHDHSHGGCCGGHTADMKFQAEQTIRLASVTLNVVKNMQHGKPKSEHEAINAKIQDYVEKHIHNPKQNLAGHECHSSFRHFFGQYDGKSSCCGGHGDNHKHHHDL